MTQHPNAPARFVPVTALALALAAGCALVAAGCRKDKGAPAKRADAALQQQSFARQWAIDLALRGDTVTALHVRDESVYTYTRAGRAYCLARDSGSVRYMRPIHGGATALHPPIEMKEKYTMRGERNEPTTVSPVIFPTATTLEIYDRLTGRFIRNANLGFSVRSDAVGRAGSVYLGAAKAGSARGAAVDIRQPYVPVRWELMVHKSAISAAPAVYEDAVYFGAEDGSVIAVTTANRDTMWPMSGSAFMTGGPIYGDLAVDGDNVYAASGDSKLYALNRNNGKIRWQYYAGQALRSGPVVTPDTVYQFVPGTGVVALDKGGGGIRKPRWTADDATQFLAQDDRNAYLRRKDNAIVARDKQTGEAKFVSQRRDLDVFSTNTITQDGMMYAATRQGRVIAIRPVLRPGTVGEVVGLDLREP